MKVESPTNIVNLAGGDKQHVLPGLESSFAELRTEEKKRLLKNCFTDLDGNIHAIKSSVPPAVAAALIARFSRANEMDITELFWKEFVEDPEGGIELTKEVLLEQGIEEKLATEKARAMIRRIIDRFGDDSVREDASGYIVVEGVSVLVAEEIFFDPLVVGIEASTRFIRWDQKDENGNYRYTRPAEIMNSKHADTYVKAMDNLFETYGNLWEKVWDYVVTTNPRPEEVTETAYNIAVTGRVCDNLRKLLPLGIETNFGIHARYRTFSELIMNMRASKLPEARQVADGIAEQLIEVNPEFIAVVDSKHGDAWTKYKNDAREVVDAFVNSDNQEHTPSDKDGVTLKILNREDALQTIVEGLIAEDDPSLDSEEIARRAKEKIDNNEIADFFKQYGETRTNRRHKVLDVLDRVVVEMKVDGISFGSHKDLNRHRKRLHKTEPNWRGNQGIYVPEDIATMGGEVLEEYLSAQHQARQAFLEISKDLPVEARRLLTHGFKTSFMMTIGLGEAYWMAELRSMASGDPEYRKFAQDLWNQMKKEIPELVYLGSFVDENDYKVGRINEAVRADLKGKTK